MEEIDYTEAVKRITGIYSSCSVGEKEIFKSILEEVSDRGYSRTLEQVWLQDFTEVPVSIEQFISDPLYLGETNDLGEMVYPFWKETLSRIFQEDKNYYEVIFSGATRIGKSSTAVTALAYMLYRLMIYRDPHKYFNKKSISKFTIAFANLTIELAKSVAYREYNDTLKQSKWFNDHGKFTRSESNYYYLPDGNYIEIIAVSDSAHLLGKQLFAVLMDEVNFSKSGIKDINKAKNSMQSMYNTANARIAGSFRLHGQVYGKMFTCSSKNTDQDYLSEHIENQLDAGVTTMYLVDEPQWKVLPSRMFSRDTFWITVGDRYRRGFVVEDENVGNLDEYRKEYDVLEVPKDYLPNFKSDYDIALRDIAGISVVGSMGFLMQESITANLSEDRSNPFAYDILVTGLQDGHTLQEYCDVSSIPSNLLKLPAYIHLDLAETSDHIGISAVVQDGSKTILDNVSEKKVSLPYFRQLFQIAVECPRSDRMSYSKVVDFLVWLRQQHMNIVKITTDQFQSSYVRETLSQKGFETDKLSVDKTEDPYISLRNLLQEQRIELIHHQLQEDELVHLQRYNGKIDHPPQHEAVSSFDNYSRSGPVGKTKSGIGKDCADALCGAAYMAMMEAGNSKSIDSSRMVDMFAKLNNSPVGSSNAPVGPNVFRGGFAANRIRR